MCEQCKICEKELDESDTVYRVLYGKYEHAKNGNVSQKQIAHGDEDLEPGVDERWYCFECYKNEFDRENGAHYTYRNANELYKILNASDGHLVADAKPLTIGGRAWVRVVDGVPQARHAIRIAGDENDDYDIKFATEPTEDFDRSRFDELFNAPEDRRLAILKPVDETPFVAGMNRTLGTEYR